MFASMGEKFGGGEIGGFVPEVIAMSMTMIFLRTGDLVLVGRGVVAVATAVVLWTGAANSFVVAAVARIMLVAWW